MAEWRRVNHPAEGGTHVKEQPIHPGILEGSRIAREASPAGSGGKNEEDGLKFFVVGHLEPMSSGASLLGGYQGFSLWRTLTREVPDFGTTVPAYGKRGGC